MVVDNIALGDSEMRLQKPPRGWLLLVSLDSTQLLFIFLAREDVPAAKVIKSTAYKYR